MSHIVSMTSPATFQKHQTTSLRCRTSCRRHRLRHFTTPNDIVTMSYIGSTTSPTTFQDTKRHRYDVVHRVDDIAYDISIHQFVCLDLNMGRIPENRPNKRIPRPSLCPHYTDSSTDGHIGLLSGRILPKTFVELGLSDTAHGEDPRSSTNQPNSMWCYSTPLYS